MRSNAGAIDPGCGMGLSSIVNACYENNPDNRVAMQQSRSYSSSALWSGRPAIVRAAVGPPAYMAGGGFENTYQKQQKVKRENDTGQNKS